MGSGERQRLQETPGVAEGRETRFIVWSSSVQRIFQDSDLEQIPDEAGH